MVNVLPENLKKEIKSEYRLRFLIICIFTVICLEIIFFLSLIPSLINSSFKEKELIGQINNVNDLSYNDSDTISSVIENTNIRLKIINSTVSYPEFIPILKNIITSKISGVKINEIFYTADNATSSTVSISGIANSRESLISFENILIKNGMFKSVDFPISNLAKDKNINFSMSMKVYK